MGREVESRLVGLAAATLRRVLVEEARKRGKRAPEGRGPSEAVEALASRRWRELLALDAALDELSATGARQARVVELRYFGGLSAEETAQVLHVSAREVEADWRFARAWLNRALTRRPDPDSATARG